MKATAIARLLPEYFEATAGRGGPLDAFLAAQEHLHAPCEAAIERLPRALDPRLAAPEFVLLLAHWLDLDYLLEGPPGAQTFSGGIGRLRELLVTAARNARERGTRETLLRMLETATGCSGFEVQDSPTRAFHFTLIAPAAARSLRPLVARIVAAEKPAFATCVVAFAPEAPPVDRENDAQRRESGNDEGSDR